MSTPNNPTSKSTPIPTPTLLFIPGSWHKPTCFNKVTTQLEQTHNLKCISITLPSTQDNPLATFKDDIDAARDAIISETSQGRNVIVLAHSYGGMVGNSAVKGLTRPKPTSSATSTLTSTSTSASTLDSHTQSQPQPQPQSQPRQDSSSSSHDHEHDHEHNHGYVTALILIASGFTITGLAFMDPFLGHPPPSWRINASTGYADLTADPRSFFYHDLPPTEAEYWTSQLTTQSLKALFEGGEHAYAGWRDVPTWYIGTVEDRGLPVLVQRVQVSVARACGAEVYHVEMGSSHSPFLSLPREVVEVIVDAVRTVSGDGVEEGMQRDGEVGEFGIGGVEERRVKKYEVPMVRLFAPGTWFRFGIPLVMGRFIGWGAIAFMGLRRLWRGK